MEAKTCNFLSCGRAILSKGLCSGHYQQMSKGRELTPLRNANRTRNDGPCSFDPCDRLAVGYGLCAGHLSQHKRGAELSPLRSRRPGALCSFPGCERPHFAKSWCNGHWQQADKGKELTSLIERRDPSYRDDRDRKQCRRCDSFKTEDLFPASKASSDGLNGRCRDCVRSERMERQFGLSVDMYRRLLSRQHGGCAICGRGPGPNSLSFHVDHDHSCCPDKGRSCGSCIRGLLCSSCNVAIGLLRDNPATLRKAADYLDAS